jgi:hypothetical protein
LTAGRNQNRPVSGTQFTSPVLGKRFSKPPMIGPEVDRKLWLQLLEGRIDGGRIFVAAISAARWLQD